MFKLQNKKSFFWPVRGATPIDGGEYEEYSFEAEFKRLAQSKLDEIAEQSKKGELNFRKIAGDVLVGWKGVMDASGEKEVIFTPESKREFLDQPGAAMTLVAAFFDAINGGRAKN